MYRGKKIARGGWSGFGMVTVGIDPNTFEVLNGHPNKIPTDKILGGVVQNCPTILIFLREFLLFAVLFALVAYAVLAIVFYNKDG